MQSELPDLGKSLDFAWVYHGESTAITMKLQMSLWSLQSSRASFSRSLIGQIFQLITLTCLEAILRKKRGKMRWGAENTA